MKQIILFVLIFLVEQPLSAATLGDCHIAIEQAFPGKIVGLSGAPGAINRIDYAPGVSVKTKSDIQTFVQSYDWNQRNLIDIDHDIEAEIKKAANDKSLSDAQFEEIRVKLGRAKNMTKATDKEAKLEEVTFGASAR